MATEFCPQCRTARVGALRYCRSCAFDYDTLPAPEAGSAVPGVAPEVGAAMSAPQVQRAAGPSIEWAGAVILIGGALACLGSLLPWITATAAFVGTISRNGFDGGGDGIFTAGLGLVIALMGIAILARSGNARTARIGTAICAAVLLWVAVMDINAVNDRLESLDAGAFGSVGMGLIVIVFGGVVAIIGSGIPASRRA